MKARADGALVAASATVAVCTQPANTSTQPCSTLATLYTDATLATPCTGTLKDGSLSGATNCSNPLVTDSKGNYHFYAKPGDGPFTIQTYGSGLVTSFEPDINLPCAPNNCNGIVEATSQPGADISAKVAAAYTAGNCATNYCTIRISAPGPSTVTVNLNTGSVTLPTWNYSSDIVFASPVNLECAPGVWLNYTGSGKAIKQGPDGMTINTRNPLPYIVNGCGFTGGATMTSGIYHNRFVIKSYVMNVRMWNFGNATAYNIFFQAENWYSHLQNIWMWSESTSPVCYNGIIVNGVATDNTTYDNGDSFVRFLGVHLQDLSQTCHGIGINVNSFQADFNQVDVLGGFDQLVRLRKGANKASFVDFYGETINTVAGVCGILYGDLSTDPAASVNAYTDSLITGRTFYINLHNTDFATTAHAFCPATATSGLQNANLDGVTVANITAAQKVVVQNNLGSQIGNIASNTRYSTSASVFPVGAAIGNLHTTGASITGWGGTDEQLILQNGVPFTQQDANGVQRFALSNTVGGTTTMGNSGVAFLAIDSTGTPTLGTSTTSFNTFQGHNQVVGDYQFLEQTAPSGAASRSVCYADSTLHTLKCSYNNGTFFQIPQVIAATSSAFATATTAGTCVQNVTAVTGATTAMAVSISPVSTPGVGAQWSAFVSSAGNVTINECAVAASAGGSIAFNIRVFP